MTVRLKPIPDQVIVVAGATTAIGAAAARAAATAGARVMLIGAHEPTLGEAVRAINNAGGRADYAVAPDGNDAALAAAGRVAVGRFGRVDSWLAEVPDAAALASARAAAVPLLRREGGALVVIAGAGVSPPVEALRAELSHEAPLVALGLVTAAADAASERIAAAALACTERTGRDTAVDASPPPGFAARHPGVIAALGIGGVALAAGAIARWRRGRSA